MKRIFAAITASAMLLIFAVCGSAESLKIGDIDGNGKITAGDARLALRGAASLEKLSEMQLKLADIDGNGRITASDARMILRRAANLEDDFGELTTQAPETTTQAPETTTQAPETTTQAPETTTQAPETTTEAPETTTEAPETTTQAPETTTEPAIELPEGAVAYKDFPEEIKTLIGGKFTLKGYNYSDSGKQEVSIITDGKNVRSVLAMSVSGEKMNISVILKDEKTSLLKTNMYIISEDTKRYFNPTPLDLKTMGIDEDELSLQFNFGDDINKIYAMVGEGNVFGTSYTTYRIDSETGYSVLYLTDGKIKFLDSYDNKDNLSGRIEITDFSASVDSGAFSTDGYSRALTIMGLFDFL